MFIRGVEIKVPLPDLILIPYNPPTLHYSTPPHICPKANFVVYSLCVFLWLMLGHLSVTAKKRQQRPLFPRGKVHQNSLLEQGGGRHRAGDSDHRDHCDR
jgi:hypothetical protein